MTHPLTVFKDARNQWRWLTVSSNGYLDRDGEIVSTASLEADSDRMMREGTFGPLRWWHMGEPNAQTREAGPGIDLGTCDFSAMHGRMNIESGTFHSPVLAQALAQAAPRLAVSKGFFYDTGHNPDSDGVFHAIHTFERSLAPAGRVSNRYTAFSALTTKEHAMDGSKLAALKTLTGLTDEQLREAVLAPAEKAQAQADADGVRFKADDRLAALEAQIAALKAEMVGPAEEGEMAEEQIEGEEMAAEEPGALTDLSVAQLTDLIAQAVAQAIGSMGTDLMTKLSAMDEEMKGLGYSRLQKDDARAAQIAALEASLKELIGDQPAQGYRASADPQTILKTATGAPATLTGEGRVVPAGMPDVTGEWKTFFETINKAPMTPIAPDAGWGTNGGS